MHENLSYGVPKSGLCRGVGGKLSTENNPWDFTLLSKVDRSRVLLKQAELQEYKFRLWSFREILR